MANYKIDDVAKLVGLTKRTIRYYEEIGLLFPPERTDGGYRVYSNKHIERLKEIISTREVLGISLQEVQEFVTVREEVSHHILELRQTKDAAEKHQQLLKFEQVLTKQLQMINRKMEKITEIRNQTNQYYVRVQDALKKYDQRQE